MLAWANVSNRLYRHYIWDVLGIDGVNVDLDLAPSIIAIFEDKFEDEIHYNIISFISTNEIRLSKKGDSLPQIMNS